MLFGIEVVVICHGLQETFVEVFQGGQVSHGGVGSINIADRKTVSRKKGQIQYDTIKIKDLQNPFKLTYLIE
jgi:hypothetical protein